MKDYYRVEHFDRKAWVGFSRFDSTGKPEFDLDTKWDQAQANAFCAQLKARYKGGLFKVVNYDGTIDR